MKKDIFKIVLWIVVGILIISIFQLPDIIPLHYNSEGYVDRYGSRYWLILLHMLPLLIYYGMDYTKKIDPHYKNILKKEKIYELYKKIISLFFVVISAYITYFSSKSSYNDFRFVAVLLGMLLIIMGNYMPKLPQNHYLGIRTFWTINDEYVWKKTHRIGGVIFVICGLFYFICSFIYKNNMLIYSTMFFIISSIYLFIYSYRLYKRRGN